MSEDTEETGEGTDAAGHPDDPEHPDHPEHRSFLESERQHRLDKLDALRDRGINPYPVRFDREGRAGPLHNELGHLKPGEASDRHVALAGRVVGMRRHGGLDFADLRDETGQIQVMADRDHLGQEVLEDFNALDLGDWIGVSGPIVCSEHGELSVRAESFQLLSKAIRALPDFRKGLADAGDRYRRRYLDLIVDEPSRRTFAIRSKVISTTRKVLLDRGFTEVETPVLLSQAGGAEARPFITHHNALDIDMYLRIALELPLKRLIVGGMNRVFEIGRVFRNEGLDTRHNPEFTLLEAYQAFGDYHDMMDLVEEIVSTSCIEAIGTTVVQIDGKDVDLKPPWRRATMAELIEENAGVKMHPSMPIDEARAIADRFNVEWLEVWGAGKIMSEVYDETCEAKLIEPTFVMDHPRETSPLARPHRDDPTLTERFEMVVAARELANAYSELNDPVDQAQRFQDEARLQAGGDEEVEPVDDDYVEALEYGLPPTGGLGIGMDRLVMLISGAEAIRDVILFPTLRPEGSDPLGTKGSDPGLAPGEQGLTPDEAPPAAPQLAPVAVQAPTAHLRHRSRAPRILAWLTALLGLASLLPTLPWIHVSLGIGDLLDRSGRADLFVVSALIGLGLITIANQLARRKHRAWVLAMLLLGAAALVHIIKGPDPIAAVLDIALLVALASYRTEFHARGDRSSLRQAVAFVPLFFLVVIAFGFFSLLTQRNDIEPGLSLGGMIDATFSGLVGGDGPYTFGHKLFEDFFSDALLALGIAGLIVFLYLVFRSIATRGTPERAERERAREIVHAYGSDTLAYFALRRDKSYFFSSDGRSLIAYAYVRGYAMVAADPIGPPEDTGRTIDEFLAFCDEQGWAVAFLAVREEDLPVYAERGMHSLYLGDEAILQVQDFTLDGSEMKAVRAAVRRVGKDHDFQIIRETEASTDLVAELNEISAEWRDGAEERGFTMELGQDVEGTDPDFVIAIAREKSGAGPGRVAGFLRFVPCFGDSPGYSLDLMRRRPDSTNGLTEYLIANAALGLKASGVQRLSLNFAAWGRLLDDAEGAGIWGRIEQRMARALNPFFQIQSLRDFNQKFDPEWYPRSIVIDDPADLPKVTVLYASVEGFLEVPVIGRFLEPPVRAAERGEASGASGAAADAGA